MKANPKHHSTLIRTEKWWVDQARKDPAMFMHYVSGFKPAKHHKIWMANLWNPNIKRLNLIAPRESAKTTVITYFMLWYISQNPTTSNGIVSVSSAQAEDRLRMMRIIMRDNVRYQNVFPHIVIDTKMPNTQNQFQVKRVDIPYSTWSALLASKGSLKDPTLVVAGAGSKALIGKRYSGILTLDDIVDETMLTDVAQEKRLVYIMQTLVPALQESAKLVNIGTRWMLNDVPGMLKNNPQWKTIEIPAIGKDRQGRRRSYWEEYWSLDKLDRKRAEMNNDVLFQTMYLNDPTATLSANFDEDSLSHDVPYPRPEYRELWIVTDWAATVGMKSDYTVLFLVGVTQDKFVDILEMRRFQKHPQASLNELYNMYDECLGRAQVITGILFESVGFQAFAKGMITSQRPDLPIHAHKPTGSKEQRVQNVAAYAHAGKLRIRQDMRDIGVLKHEWINFGFATHDDTIDPISLFFQRILPNISIRKVHYVKSDFLI